MTDQQPNQELTDALSETEREMGELHGVEQRASKKIKAIQEEIADTDLGRALAFAKLQKRAASTMAVQTRETLDALAVQLFELTGEKSLTPAIGVRESWRVEVECESALFTFALANAPHWLQLDHDAMSSEVAAAWRVNFAKLSELERAKLLSRFSPENRELWSLVKVGKVPTTTVSKSKLPAPPPQEDQEHADTDR